MADIKGSIESAISYLTDHPDEVRYTDSVATATMGDDLRVTVEGGHGTIVTDMPKGVGGRAELASPGWLLRAAVASCVATVIGMEAARADVDLSELVVEVDSESDDRGILGMDPDTDAGPASMSIRITTAASGTDAQRLREVVATGADRCPVCDAAKRSVDVSVEIATG